jgi:N-acetylmuramoyl-L-alanine amidase
MIKIIFNVGLYSLVIAVLVSILVPKDTQDQRYYDHPIPSTFLDGPITPLYKDGDLFCLAKNVFHEAGTEPDIGKYAVAQVTLNRVRNPQYPNSICKVVLQRYQFSWANDSSKHETHPQGKNWDRSYIVAKSVLDGEEWITGLDHVQYYHADYVSPKWASKMTPVTTIGKHIFYTHY